ncbi:hypothetical protein BFP97_19860 [Roseivirga sp. 4D4]|uniref:hypothetical protein n=1 Tax=Roseivirga sp. 4D4 TaxID=1889784 RepID=UPI000852D52A|nr:hypothetical protein [Roseivirga sp. 4D4]OEK03634.1 hypothetical protein BFP97_19860 [Roseivirga sp. 4D4]
MNNKGINYFKVFSYTLTVCCFGLFIYALFVGDNLALPWEVQTTFKTRPLLLEYFQLNGEASGLYIDQIISWQKYTTGDINYLAWPEALLFLVFYLALVSITTLVSYFDRFSYFMVSGVVVFTLIQLRLEELGISDPYLTYGAIGGYFVLTYLFQSFFPQTKLWVRLVASMTLYGALVAIILLLTNAADPYLLNISYGVLSPIIFITIFIVFIAGDNIFSLFKLTTQGAVNGKNSLKHFSIIGSIYVLLAILLFLQRIGSTEIDIYFLNPYVLLTFSVISGFFSIERKLENMAQNIDLRLIRYWLYPLGASLMFCLISWAHLTVNDSIVNAIEWVIIISHMTFGIAFFAYALINFIPPLLSNLEVWPIFFKGLRTPILMVRLMAFVLFLGGIFYLENRPYYQVKAGQYSMLASLANRIDNELLTDQYYKQSVYFDFYNFKANYSLTRIAEGQREVNEVPNQLRSILEASINPKARIAFANYYADRDLLYRELTSLMNSPESSSSEQVRNNLGLSHYRYSNYDSAYSYFAKNESSVISEANLAALNYDLAANVNFDTTVTYDHTEDIHVMINRQALANAQKDQIAFKLELDKDTLLIREDLFYLYNAALSQNTLDQSSILKSIDYYLGSQKNNIYSNFLLIAKAMALYNAGEINQAFKTIETSISSNQGAAGFPYFVKAIWAYDQGQVDLTIEGLDRAQKNGYNEPQVKSFIDKIKVLDVYTEKADISSLLSRLEDNRASLDSADYTKRLESIALKNAFDEKTTLKAINLLREISYSENAIYDLLLEAITVNIDSPVLLEEYIYQCAKTGFSSFGRTALSKIEGMVDATIHNEISLEFERLISARREDLLNR